MKISGAVGWKQVVHCPCRVWVQRIVIYSVAADRNPGRPRVLREQRSVSGWRADAIIGDWIEVVRDDQPTIPENREIQPERVMRMIPNRRLKMDHQRSTLSDRNDLVFAVGRIEWVSWLAERIDPGR